MLYLQLSLSYHFFWLIKSYPQHLEIQQQIQSAYDAWLYHSLLQVEMYLLQHVDKPCIYSSRADERRFENIEDAKAKSIEMLSKAYSPFGSVKKVKQNKTKPYDNLNI